MIVNHTAWKIHYNPGNCFTPKKGVSPNGREKSKLRNLPDADESRSEPEIVHGQVLALAYHLVPGLEGVSEISGRGK